MRKLPTRDVRGRDAAPCSMTALPTDSPPAADMMLVGNFAPGEYSWAIDGQGRLAIYLLPTGSAVARDGQPRLLPTLAEIQARNDEFYGLRKA